jgi:transposase
VDIGIDLHKRQWGVAVYVGGYEHKVFVQPPRVEALAAYVKRHFPGARYRCVYEAGCFGFWVHDALWEQGLECMVVHPGDVPTRDKERRHRTDRVDARKLARGLRGGELTGVYVPSRGALEARSLVRMRWELVKKQTRVKNQILAMLTLYGMGVSEEEGSRRWSQAFLQRLGECRFGERCGQQAFEVLLTELQYLRALVAGVTRDIRALSQEESYRGAVRHLVTIPGIGPLTAMILLTELMDIDRFRTLDQLASYVGLVPGEDSSGERERTTGLTRRRNAHLRRLLIEASWVAVRKDPALMLCFLELGHRMPKTQAIVRIARKLLNRIRYVLKHQVPYQIGVGPSGTNPSGGALPGES